MIKLILILFLTGCSIANLKSYEYPEGKPVLKKKDFYMMFGVGKAKTADGKEISGSPTFPDIVKD